MLQFPETTEALFSLKLGAKDFWIAIDGGGYEGEFDKDTSLQKCSKYQDLIQNLHDNGCNVTIWYHKSFNHAVKKDYYTKVLVVTLNTNK